MKYIIREKVSIKQKKKRELYENAAFRNFR